MEGRIKKKLTDVVAAYLYIPLFDTHYEILSRNYVSRTALPQLYTELRDRVKN